MKKKTLVIGASPNPERYAHKAVLALSHHGHPVTALGLRPGKAGDTPIVTERPGDPDFDTVTFYVGSRHQPGYYDYVATLKPRRVIFNPGTENPEFARLLNHAGILTEEACTLVLLATNQY
ncbi:MAG TPA: CoA-binding protein [Prolixibacteraceae bacterium]|nr:CoA-binding protein [Prolixibacteraceae bacterium]